MFAEAIQAGLVLSSERESQALEKVLATPLRWLNWLWSQPLRRTISNTEQIVTFLASEEWHTWSEEDVRTLQSRLDLLVKLHDRVLRRAKGLPFAKQELLHLEALNDRLDSFAETMQMAFDPALREELAVLVNGPATLEEPSDWREFVRSLEN